jgi:transcriptional regulator with XRE-family HTH domain
MVIQSVMPGSVAGAGRIETDFRADVKRFFVPDALSNSGMGTIGQRVRKLREERGMDRPAFAAAVGMPTTSLQTLEEQPQKTSRHLPKIASYCGVTVEWLSTGKGLREAPVKDSLDEYGWASHFGKFDPQSLALALQWMRWQDEQGLQSQPERLPERLMALYRRFLADGGKETAAHISEIAAAIEQGEKRVNRTARGKAE